MSGARTKVAVFCHARALRNSAVLTWRCGRHAVCCVTWRCGRHAVCAVLTWRCGRHAVCCVTWRPLYLKVRNMRPIETREIVREKMRLRRFDAWRRPFNLGKQLSVITSIIIVVVIVLCTHQSFHLRRPWAVVPQRIVVASLYSSRPFSVWHLPCVA